MAPNASHTSPHWNYDIAFRSCSISCTAEDMLYQHDDEDQVDRQEGQDGPVTVCSEVAVMEIGISKHCLGDGCARPRDGFWQKLRNEFPQHFRIRFTREISCESFSNSPRPPSPARPSPSPAQPRFSPTQPSPAQPKPVIRDGGRPVCGVSLVFVLFLFVASDTVTTDAHGTSANCEAK